MIRFFDDDSTFANALCTVILVAMVLLSAVGLYKTTFADGRISHCYVEQAQGGIPAYRITGHRDWRLNVTLGIEKSAEEANAKMKEVCP